jgi:hypothetical protein
LVAHLHYLPNLYPRTAPPTSDIPSTHQHPRISNLKTAAPEVAAFVPVEVAAPLVLIPVFNGLAAAALLSALDCMLSAILVNVIEAASELIAKQEIVVDWDVTV